ncbi:MAG: hypothetical protein OHK0019_12460 [Saprospiraceae bacterium]
MNSFLIVFERFKMVLKKDLKIVHKCSVSDTHAVGNGLEMIGKSSGIIQPGPASINQTDF